jgi:hypothetical protein
MYSSNCTFSNIQRMLRHTLGYGPGSGIDQSPPFSVEAKTGLNYTEIPPYVCIKKVNGSLYRPKAQGAYRYSSTLSLVSALEGGGMASSTPRPLYPREGLGTHCTGGLVGPRAHLDGCGKSRPYRDSIPRPSSHVCITLRLII